MTHSRDERAFGRPPSPWPEPGKIYETGKTSTEYKRCAGAGLTGYKDSTSRPNLSYAI